MSKIAGHGPRAQGRALVSVRSASCAETGCASLDWRRLMGVRSVLIAAFSLLSLALLPAAAGAFATITPPARASSGSGLPDGRVYEQVSPANKYGHQAGANSAEPGSTRVSALFSIASPNGDAVAYGSQGPAAEVDSSGINENFVAERTDDGWVSRSTTGRGLALNEKVGLFVQQPVWRDYTPDLSHLLYAKVGAEVQGPPLRGTSNVYLMASNPLEEPTWLLRGLGGAALEERQYGLEIVGISPNADVIYFACEAKLLPEDASRSGWGIYEYRNGTVGEAGVLPDGSVPSEGAMPVATATAGVHYHLGENNPASLDNQVSEDGMRLFFVSGKELYVHETEADGSQRSVLVSASQLLGHEGEAAPDGVALFRNRTKNADEKGAAESAPTYAYASPDGSHVFFQSEDQLTRQAPAAPGLKVYDFDLETGALEYLPNVALGGIVTSAQDGSSFAFVNDATTPEEIDRWAAGPGGGSVTPIAQLPGGGFVGPGRMAAGDSVIVFQASAPIPGFNDAGGEEIFRYAVGSNELSCVSCPPAGDLPSGDVYLSAIDQYQDYYPAGTPTLKVINDARGVSADGERIFFDSSDPLVSRDTDGQLDAYEWENGTVFLISSGTSSGYSLFLDNSESGGDVFFATSDELVQGDNDEGYDVYDARIPRPGDNPPPSAVPCEGDVCQGPPSVAELLGLPPSATFNGLGNLAESAQGNSRPKRTHGRRQAAKRRQARARRERAAKARRRQAAKARRRCRKKAGRKRLRCERQVRRLGKHKSGRGK